VSLGSSLAIARWRASVLMRLSPFPLPIPPTCRRAAVVADTEERRHRGEREPDDCVLPSLGRGQQVEHGTRRELRQSVRPHALSHCVVPFCRCPCPCSLRHSHFMRDSADPLSRPGKHTFYIKVDHCGSGWMFIGVATKDWDGWRSTGTARRGRGASIASKSSTISHTHTHTHTQPHTHMPLL
jgi:hypothetical protein